MTDIYRRLGGFNPIEDFGAPRENIAINPFTGNPIASAAGQVATSMTRGIPQLATGLIDLASLPLTMTETVKPENVFGSTAQLTKQGFLPPAQTGLINQGTELVSSMLNPPLAAKNALMVGLGGVLNSYGKGKKIYHGTSNANAEKIAKEGFNTNHTGSVWFTDNINDIKNKNVGAGESGAIVQRNIDESDMKLGGWEEQDKFLTDELIARGYDGLKLEEGGNTTYQIFNQNSIKDFTPEMGELWRKTSLIPKDKQLQNLPQDPRARQSFKNYLDGKISQTDYIKNIQNFYPATKITEIPDYPSGAELVYGLGKKADGGKNVVNFGAKFDEGDKVLSRLDIPAYNNYNVWSASLQGADGKTVYGQTVHLTDKGGKIKFNINPNDAIRIAKGKELGGSNKFPMAKIEGSWKNTSPDDVKKLAKKYLNDPEWSQVGMNPKRFGYFYNKADNMPVSEADEVIQIGALVLAKNIKTFNPSKSVTTTKTPSGGLLSF